ncbi:MULTISPECIES: hypothetical protein [unclassified Arthrobacter]|uniref:hypothetical protein n=1 Tax=unclassified Arthrobacter TaxID=235627 RepID=UPI0033954C35
MLGDFRSSWRRCDIIGWSLHIALGGRRLVDRHVLDWDALCWDILDRDALRGNRRRTTPAAQTQLGSARRIVVFFM